MSPGSNNEKTQLTTKKIILIGIVLLIVLNFTYIINLIKYVSGIIAFLFIGAGIAFILNILVCKYGKIYFPESKNQLIIKSRRGMAIVFSILTIILVLYFLLYLVIPEIVRSINLISDDLPNLYEKVVRWIDEHSKGYPMIRQRLEQIDINGEEAIDMGLGIINSWAFGPVSFIGMVFNKIIQLLLGIVFAIYVLFHKETLKSNFNKLINAYLNKDKRNYLLRVIKTADETFTNFFLGQFKEAIIFGLLTIIGMLILRLPYALTIGTVVGATALIPMVGAFIGAGIGVLLILLVDAFKAVIFIIFIIILQQIESNFIYPKVIGSNIGLPKMWVFAAIIIGGGFMGVIGILLGVPVAATIYKLLGKSVNEKLKVKKA